MWLWIFVMFTARAFVWSARRRMFRQKVHAQVQWGGRTFPRGELIESVANVSDHNIDIAWELERQIRDLCGRWA
jgi:hypothetical protein